MDEGAVAGFRARLEAELEALAAEDALGAAGQKTVALDQSAVGRLSRMDALQGQAKATAARRAARRARIAAAFARMDDGDFGHCTDCGEAIAPARLDLDPTVPTCIGCTSG
ncbi:MAG: TraR/DksA C4-type zinc finger protein [Paracoccaceae bacterium]